jgi:threonine/homoserine/homoserine lactone efflux protein
MDGMAVGLFLVSATALLGSPGPGIVALIFVARSEGLSTGLRYYAGLQIGLAAAAAASAAGLFSLFSLVPATAQAMSLIAVLYLLYLAWAIATAPAGSVSGRGRIAASPWAGILLGVTNPKAYLAFASLMASATLVKDDPRADDQLKWALCVAVMLVVDLALVLVGVWLRRAGLSRKEERLLNLALAAMIVAAAALTLL